MSSQEIEHELMRGSGFVDGKFRIRKFFETRPSSGNAVAFLRNEYGTGGHSHTFLNGEDGFVNHTPSDGFKATYYPTRETFTVTWSKVEKHLREMISQGRYLTAEEKAKYAVKFPKAPTVWEQYQQAKHDNPKSLVLFQLGDFFEAFADDAQTVARELELALTTREVGIMEDVPMCGIPAHRLDEWTQKLVNAGHNVVQYKLEDGERKPYHFSGENEYELGFGNLGGDDVVWNKLEEKDGDYSHLYPNKQFEVSEKLERL